MDVSAQHHEIVNSLRSAVGSLDSSLDPQVKRLRREVGFVCDRLVSPEFRIAVFGPFNYGKSTLLNAMLGEKALPIDLIPTTGAAIRVGYGPELTTRITLMDGSEVCKPGTEVLKSFAVLDDDRRMREDVASVEVTCPHPLLQRGIELLDLPGTDDRDAQEALVREQLLTADLVVQVLDGRKLMTLAEREHLRDWLTDRGIETIVFVVNFLNLLGPEEQQEVSRRMRFVAESFRAALPAGVSNLYRVDALPALRARLKGDGAAAQTTGLPDLEAALLRIVEHQRSHLFATRLPRALAIAPQVKRALEAQIQVVGRAVADLGQGRDRQKIEILQKAQTLIQQGFDKSMAELESWLALPNLLTAYRTEAAGALRRFDFKTWEEMTLRPAWKNRQRAVVGWVYKACEFFNCPRPVDLWLAFPPEPTVPIPDPTSTTGQGANLPNPGDAAPVAIATGLGWVLGGPLGAAVFGGTSYLLNQLDNPRSNPVPPSSETLERLYEVAARDYLSQFSAAGFKALENYVIAANPVIRFPLPKLTTSAPTVTPQTYQLQLLQSSLENLNRVLESLEA
ncbi:MAG: dynamin family protein [Synechococcales bacterium]|nr:dynamin family protein [Synechococcales bacterium]